MNFDRSPCRPAACNQRVAVMAREPYRAPAEFRRSRSRFPPSRRLAPHAGNAAGPLGERVAVMTAHARAHLAVSVAFNRGRADFDAVAGIEGCRRHARDGVHGRRVAAARRRDSGQADVDESSRKITQRETSCAGLPVAAGHSASIRRASTRWVKVMFLPPIFTASSPITPVGVGVRSAVPVATRALAQTST